MAVLRRLGRRRALLIGLALVACGSAAAGALVADRDDRERLPPEASGRQPAERVSFLARLVPQRPERPVAGGPRASGPIADLARRLPLERKVAQVFLVGFRGRDLTADVFFQLRRLDLGGVLLERANYAGLQLLGQMAGEARVIAEQERHLPPLVAASQEGGEFNAFPELPPADAPADIGSARAAGAQAMLSGQALRPLGVTTVLGPVLDVGLVDEPALGPRVFSDDPAAVAEFARSSVQAYRRTGVIAAAKHFPGLGSASQPTEEGPATVGLSLEELRQRDLVPFRAAFRAGVPAVVLSHALYAPDDFTIPGSLSRSVATDLLRRELRFRGLAITDDLADPAVTSQFSVPEAAVRALRAGADMLLVSGPASDQQAAYVAVLRAVRSGQVPRRRLEQAVLRILAVKKAYGLIR